MVYCAVMGCSNNRNKRSKHFSDCRFFRFPKNKQVCEQWIQKCYQRHTFNVKNGRVCSIHFVESDYCLKSKLLKLPQNKWRLKSDAVPSLHLIKSPPVQTPQQNRAIRRIKRLNNDLIRESQQESEISKMEAEVQHEISSVETQCNETQCSETQGEEIENFPEKITISTQTTSEIDLIEQVKVLQAENTYLKKLLQKEKKKTKKMNTCLQKATS